MRKQYDIYWDDDKRCTFAVGKKPRVNALVQRERAQVVRKLLMRDIMAIGEGDIVAARRLQQPYILTGEAGFITMKQQPGGTEWLVTVMRPFGPRDACRMSPLELQIMLKDLTEVPRSIVRRVNYERITNHGNDT